MSTMPLASPLSPFQGFALGWTRFAEFRGRSSRVEFWSFHIINFFIGFFVSLISLGILGVIFQVIIFVPSISIWVRRVHDIGRSGWWIFWAVASFAAIPLMAYGEDIIPEAINLFGQPAKPLTLAVVLIIVMNFIPFIMCFVDGDPETNKYGPNPKLNPTNPNNPV